MEITQSSLDRLRVTFSGIYQGVYENTPTNYQELATEVSSSNAENLYGWLNQQIRMTEWKGKRTALNLAERKFSVLNKKYEATVALERDDIEDDNLGVFKDAVIPQLAEAAKQAPDDLLWASLVANPTAFDGKALFAADHPCFNEGGDVYDNISSLTLDETNLWTVRTSMQTILGEDGEPLNVNPNLVVVVPALEKTIKTLLEADLISNNTNISKGLMRYIVSNKLGNTTTAWYVADTTKRIKPFVKQNRRAPAFAARDRIEDPMVWEQERFQYGVTARWAVAPTLPFLIHRGNS